MIHLSRTIGELAPSRGSEESRLVLIALNEAVSLLSSEQERDICETLVNRKRQELIAVESYGPQS